MRRRKVKKILWSLAVLALFLGGCSKDEEESSPSTEVFSGELFVDIGPSVVGQQWVDTVVLIVTEGRYTLFLTSENGVTPDGSPRPLCDSEGDVKGFGSNTLTLTPTGTLGTDCSASLVPSGEFVATFSAGGDSLTLQNAAQTDRLYRFSLKQDQVGGTNSLIGP
jgi:hypothetical protein